MKNKITRLFTKALGVAFAAMLMLLPGSSKAQYCGTSGYGCYMYSSTISYMGGWITGVTIKNSAGTVLGSYSGYSCSGSSAVLVNSGSPISITSGEVLSLEVSVGEGYWGYGTMVGVWIDADYNKNFATSECVIDPNSGSMTGVGSLGTGYGSFKVPCVNTAGNSRIRIRGGSQYYTLQASNGCNNANTYGTTLDIDVTINLASNPVADFTLPGGNIWTNDIQSFNAKSPSTSYTYAWTFEDQNAPNRTNVKTTGTKGQAIWAKSNTSPGYEVKLKVSYCSYSDSISKFLKVNAPTKAPVADFIAASNSVPIYENIILKDLSTNGPSSWNWEITTPNNGTFNINGTNLASRNPVILADDIGKWTICLTSTNGIGPSSKVCKTKYVEVTPPIEYIIGPDKEGTNKSGRLVDDGGSTGNYSNNAKPSNYHFLMLPCGAEEIKITFSELNLNDANDKIRFYDGKDEGAPLIATITSTNQATYLANGLVGYNGAMYVTFESNSSGNSSGFIANWDSKLELPLSPLPRFTTPYNPAANSMLVDFTNTSTQIQGLAEYEWLDFDGTDYVSLNTTKDYSQVFTTDGTYTMCLAAKTCNGADTWCSNINIQTPTAPGKLDYVASNRRPKVNEAVDITVTTDYANNFNWSIFPTTYTTTQDSRGNLKIKFTAGGCYTFTLKAYNTAGGQVATEKTVIKNKYICVVDPCTPAVDNLSTDVAMHKVVLKKGTATLFENETSSSVATAYQNFTSSVKADVTFGATYDFELSRQTASNPVNYKVWIDFNIDGDFDDAGETVWSSGTLSGYSATGSFTVPFLSQSFEGPTTMRIGASYNAFPNTACGTNVVGEYEDYGLVLKNDNMPPQIYLNMKDTQYVERTTTAGTCWTEVLGKTGTVWAEDPTEGDITSRISQSTDLDCTVPGIYEWVFNVSDASGNPAPTVRRTIIVVLDKTAPVLTLLGNNPMIVEQCDPFNDPGAIAIDAVDGNLSNGAIIVTGSVNSSVVGTYNLVYTVKDAQGNTATATRVVKVQDTKKPSIILRGTPIVNGTTIPVQIQSTFSDEVKASDICNGAIDVVIEPGFNGYVNTLDRRTYPIIYHAQDPSGNKATEDGYIINYAVRDYIAPTIDLKTADVIIHDVNTPYTSTAVTYSDNYYPMSKLSLTKTGTVDPYTLGTYYETYTCTDEDGNSTQVTRTVKVVDRIAPEILAPAMNVCVGQPFWAMSGLVLSDNYDSPSSLLDRVTVMNHNINIWEAGVYFINYKVTDASGNSSSMISRPVFVNYPPNCQNTYLSTAKTSLKEAVRMFPNPTTSKVTINYNIANNEPVVVTVMDMQGKVLQTATLNGGAGYKLIDMSAYAKGIYNVRLTNNGQSVVEKIVLQ